VCLVYIVRDDNTNIGIDINGDNITFTSIDINLNASPISPIEIMKFLERHDFFQLQVFHI
jgi:hypothetical protein